MRTYLIILGLGTLMASLSLFLLAKNYRGVHARRLEDWTAQWSQVRQILAGEPS